MSQARGITLSYRALGLFCAAVAVVLAVVFLREPAAALWAKMTAPTASPLNSTKPIKVEIVGFKPAGDQRLAPCTVTTDEKHQVLVDGKPATDATTWPPSPMVSWGDADGRHYEAGHRVDVVAKKIEAEQ